MEQHVKKRSSVAVALPGPFLHCPLVGQVVNGRAAGYYLDRELFTHHLMDLADSHWGSVGGKSECPIGILLPSALLVVVIIS